MSVFHQFHERLRDAIVSRLGWASLRPVQEESGKAILSGRNAIILAPTAGGKTEASFFPVLSEILQDDKDGLQALYIAPIKALLNNQAERLATYTEMVGLSRCIWHGDIGQSQRKRFLKEPDTVLMTTPESLEVMLVSGSVNHKELFTNLRFIIIDEIHALTGSDRGSHLRSVLHRILKHSKHDVLRIGLSATIGNPEDILDWLTSDSNREGVVVNPPSPLSPKEVLVVARDTDSSLAEAVASMGRGYKSLLFCQSRALTEKIAEKMDNFGVDTFVHHSSISKEERSKAEELFQREGAACIVCTSTLELGIDIGDLDKVFQAEAPTTVSSFKQRMGRTGRRKGQKANTTFFCGSRESILQATALIELTKEGWVESVEVNHRSWAVLVHQILTICMGRGGVGMSTLWELLSDVPDFSEVTEAEFYRLLKHLIKDQTLSFLDGRVLLGPKAERLFGKRNFMTLYAVFSSPQTYSVETKEKHPIGKLAQDFVDQLDEESCFILGGRPWAIDAIRHEERLIKVIPAPSGKQPTWGGLLPQFLGYDLCQKILAILQDNKQPRYLRGRALTILQEEQEEVSALLNNTSIVSSGSDHRWYTYAGGQINSTLKHALKAIGNWKVTADNFSLNIKDSRLEDIKAAIMMMKESDFWSEDGLWNDIVSHLPQYRLSKFQDILPQWAIQEMLADYLLDLKGTWRFLTGASTIEKPKPNYRTLKLEIQTEKQRKKKYTVSKRITKSVPPKELPISPESQLKLPIHWVNSDELLKRCCEKMASFTELGIDCETTIPSTRMCLLQIACRDFIVLIDPFDISDFSPLKELLETESIVVIAHNASFEKRQLAKYEIYPNNVYDTLAVSRRLRKFDVDTGEKLRHGLGIVCKRELDLDMDKGAQTSDWSLRPLSKEQLMYAALDAEVMLQLYDFFVAEQESLPSLFS